MEKRLFRTIIKKSYVSRNNGNVIEQNSYIRGRINGFATALCDSGDRQPVVVVTVDDETNEIIEYVFRAFMTEEAYEKFKRLVESNYPGLCLFDVKKD